MQIKAACLAVQLIKENVHHWSIDVCKLNLLALQFNLLEKMYTTEVLMYANWSKDVRGRSYLQCSTSTGPQNRKKLKDMIFGLQDLYLAGQVLWSYNNDPQSKPNNIIVQVIFSVIGNHINDFLFSFSKPKWEKRFWGISLVSAMKIWTLALLFQIWQSDDQFHGPQQ